MENSNAPASASAFFNFFFLIFLMVLILYYGRVQKLFVINFRP